MSAYSLPALLALALNVSLVFIISLDNPKSRTHRLFALLVFCFVVWNVADIIVINSTAIGTARVGALMIVAALSFAPAVFLLLSFSLHPGDDSRFRRWPASAAVLVPSLVLTILSGFELLAPLSLYRSPDLNVFDYFAEAGATPLTAVMYGVLFADLAGAAVNYGVRFRRATSPLERRQALDLLLGALTFVLLLVMLNALAGEQRLHFYAARMMSLLISVFFAYAVLGNRIIVLRRIGNQGVAYSIVTGSMFAFYLLVIKHLAEIIGRQLDVSSGILDGVFILILAVSFRPLVSRVQSLVESVFYQNSLRYRQRFVQFSHDSLRLTTVRDLVTAVVGFLNESLSASGALMLLTDDTGEALSSALEPDRTWPLNGSFRSLIAGGHKAINGNELMAVCPPALRPVLKAFESGCGIPLHAERGLAGLLLVGPTTTERPYTTDEIEFLTTFANGVSVILERNVLIERMRTEEIRTAKMEKLASLGRLTAGIAHEFRNPLNIISTAAQTILRNPENLAVHRETASYIVEEADRLNRTVDEFLQFAKPHTPVWECGNLDDVLNSALRALRTRAAQSNVRMVKTIPAALPDVTTSPRHLERALINLGMNAIEAMPRGGTLTLQAEPRGDSAVVLSVRDTGPGIPPEYHARLFDPFFTTKASGTGLGLVIVYMLVQSIHGTIAFATGDTGTTFSIQLPLDGRTSP